ncbi:unnamed protein product [Caenorhabditis bovis]|uniref:Uncharacterized protein n=1 Tax=Caenorhabditis bovis TaxID=2654633 RepID=A0A8S1ESX3_9PELO|nr:unnamed protein product [Caenorhabditis bovis]
MGTGEAPQLPPRTHPVHERNRAAKRDRHHDDIDAPKNDEADEVGECRSRRASSVGFVDVCDLFKYQDDYKTTTSEPGCRIYSSIRHMFHQTPQNAPIRIPESHINPMFSHKSSLTNISRSLTHLPYPPKKRKSKIRRVFSCFSVFSKHFS